MSRNTAPAGNPEMSDKAAARAPEALTTFLAHLAELQQPDTAAALARTVQAGLDAEAHTQDREAS